jgi:hypothetical protein
VTVITLLGVRLFAESFHNEFEAAAHPGACGFFCCCQMTAPLYEEGRGQNPRPFFIFTCT